MQTLSGINIAQTKKISYLCLMKTFIIGTGNVAHSLVSSMLSHPEIEIIGAHSRTAQKLIEFAGRFGIRYFCQLADIPSDADLYIICTADKGIEPTARMLGNVRGTVVHTSGSTDISVLQTIFPNCGVIYPLQTFSAARIVDIAKVPLYIEHSGPQAQQTIEQFAGIMSEYVSHMDSHQRKTMHMSAVFACNFVNHAIAASQALLKEAGLPPGMHDQLIRETVRKALSADPVLSQTGPAARHDEAIMQMHHQMLTDRPTLQAIYSLMSQSIQEFAEKYRNGI